MPKRTIPIKPAVQPRQDAEGSAPKVDYAAVVARYKGKVDNRASAIRAFCVECCCGVLSEVRNCAVTKCALYPFRNGEDPFRKKRTDGFAAKKNGGEGDDE